MWRQTPPVHYLVASYLGYEAPAGATSQPSSVVDASSEQGQALMRLMSSMPVNPNAPRLDTSAWDARGAT